MTRSRFLIGLCFTLILLVSPARGAGYIFETIALGSGNFDRVGGTDTINGAEIAINANGAVSFVGRKTTTAVTTDGIYTGAGGALTTVTTEETRVVGGNVVRKELHAPAINGAGVLAWTRYADGEGTSIRFGTSGIGAFATNNSFSNASYAAIDDNGTVFYFGSGNGFHGIYYVAAGTTQITRLARSGMPYNVVRAPYSVSRNGNVAFRAYTGSDPEVDSVYAYIAGTTTAIADNLGVYRTFDDGPTINSNGDYAFVAELKPADPNDDGPRALYLKTATTAVTQVLAETAAGLHGFKALAMRNDGTVSFNAIDGTTEEGLYLRLPDGTVERVAGTKDKLAGKAINYIYASRYGLNEAGQIAFLVYFKDFTYGVFRARGAGPGDVPHAMADAVNIRGTTKLDVLANDTPATVTGATLKITAVTAPAKGRALIVAGKAITYIPNTKFQGTDTFTYTVTSNGYTDTATVTVTNPFYALDGSFFQIVTANGAPVGTLTAKLSTGGVVSGTLLVNGKPYTLRGSAGFDGSFTQTIKRLPAGTADLVITLNFAVNNQAAEVSGGATGDANPYAFAATAVSLTALPAGIESGAYTVLLPPDAIASNPRGTGYATATLSKTGGLRLAGKLGDGTILSAGGQLNARMEARIYLPLYVKPKGLLYGTLTFSTWPSKFGGTLTWNKPPPAVQTGLFTSGFSATTAADGSRYTAVRNVRTLIYTATDARGDIHVRDGGLAAIDEPVSVTIADKITADPTNPNKVAAAISRTAGLFSGSFTPTGTTKAIKFFGVVHQGENRAAGYYLGTAQSGTVELKPQ